MVRLDRYQSKRHIDRTPEPSGSGRAGEGPRARSRRHDEAGPAAPAETEKESPAPVRARRFVVQEHHARRLHWDFRLEKDGAHVTWAVPKGIPDDPHENRLAVKVEDHPLEYIDFAGEIPSGQYGAGRVSIWDEGTYDEEKFRDDEVMVVLHGRRVSGRYVLFRTRGENWMIHRMDPPQDPGRETLPDWIPPMLAKLAADLPQDEERWGFEFKWDGIRALVRVDHGAVLARSRSGEEITHRYPELRRMGDSLGAEAVFLDGELIALDASGRPSFESLQRRIGLNKESRFARPPRRRRCTT